jgi:hypothetical protein
MKYTCRVRRKSMLIASHSILKGDPATPADEFRAAGNLLARQLSLRTKSHKGAETNDASREKSRDI